MSIHQLVSCGIYPERQKILVAKGTVAPRAAYEPVSAKVVLVDTPGTTSVNPKRFQFKRARAGDLGTPNRLARTGRHAPQLSSVYMERAAKSLARLRMSGQIAPDELALAAWPVAAGEAIARHTQAVKLVRGKLIVEVEDALWQRNLFGFQQQVLRAIRTVLGAGIVEDLEFRIARGRRPPQRETRIAEPRDEAESIRDPVLRIIYKRARQKATA